MPLMTKKGLRVLMYEAIVDGDVVEQPERLRCDKGTNNRHV